MKYLNFLLFLIPVFCSAQSAVTAKVHYGYSRPTSIEEAYRGLVYEVNGKTSQGLYLGYEKKIRRHTFSFQSGVNFLGFKTRQYGGFTASNTFSGLRFPNQFKDSLNVFLKSDYRLYYLDNSIAYGFNIKPKIKLTVAFHYLFNVKSEIKEIYNVSEKLIPNVLILAEERYINLNKVGLGFFNHFAFSSGIEFALSRRTKVGFNYQLGLTESNPFNELSRNSRILNQNFSLFLSQAIFVAP
jgi:hypothetical protein